MSVSNTGINYGHSSKLNYDQCAYEDRLKQSTKPFEYKLDVNQISNCQACLSTTGPRSSYKGYGVSVHNNNNMNPAPLQNLVDVETILSNRNLVASKCNHSKVNNIDVTKFDLKHARICNNLLNSESSLLSDPTANYREMAINRFIDLPVPTQNVYFVPFAVNTQLEAKDNYCEKYSKPFRRDNSLPEENKPIRSCTDKLYSNCQ